MTALEATGLSLVLLADTPNAQILTTSLCLVAALLVAAIVIALVKRWRGRRDIEVDVSPNAQLAQYRALYEAGTISQEEFERLRTLLGGRLRDTLGVPRKAPTDVSEPMQRPPDRPDTGIRPA